MSSQVPLPSVSHADYKRALRESKKKSDEDESQQVKELPKIEKKNIHANPPPSTMRIEKALENHLIRMAEASKSQQGKELPKIEKKKKKTSFSKKNRRIEEAISNHVARMSEGAKKRNSTSRSEILAKKRRSAQKENDSASSKKHSEQAKSDASENIHDDLINEASSSEQTEPEQIEDHSEVPAKDAIVEDEGFEVIDLQKHQQIGDELQTNVTIAYTISGESTDDQKDTFQITDSLSFNTNDDSVFSNKGPPTGSPERVVRTSIDPRQSPARRTASAIDMSGCIRKTISPSTSDSSSTTGSQNKNNDEEVVSERIQNGANRWQEFESSLTLLGTPVISWFSATVSEGAVSNDDQGLVKQSSNDVPTLGRDQNSGKETVQNDEPNRSERAKEVADVNTAIPAVEDKTRASASSFPAASKKDIITTSSSLSSTDGGSLSSRDIVGEVASKAKVEISFPRRLSLFFSTKNPKDNSDFDSNYEGVSINDWSLRTWSRVTTCIPSKNENPKQFYLFIFGFCVLSAFILSMILLMLPQAPSDASSTSTNETLIPSSAPTDILSMTPSDFPSLAPSNAPTNTPTITGRPTSSQVPSEAPSAQPSNKPSMGPSGNPTITAVPTSEPMTYVPGKLIVKSNGLILSEGLSSRIVARSGQKVLLDGLSFPSPRDEWNVSSSNPTSAPTAASLESDEVFHFKPDGAAVYPWPENDDYDGKGWIYVSNAEVWDQGGGGVGAIYFDDKGQAVDYKPLIKRTTANCSGGKTPWHTWVTCEEADDGRIFQVDPLGIRTPEEMTIGMGRGKWESFAYDIRDQSKPRFFATEDKDSGTLRRFTPDDPDWEDPWTMLQSNGTVDFLVLEPFDTNARTNGTFFWTNDLREGKDNARRYFQHSEGIDIRDNQLFVVSKTQKELFILDLDAMTYEVHSTVFGLFDGQPDQMKRLVSDDDIGGTVQDKSLLYFCEEGGRKNGVHARDSNGWYFTILESDEMDGETSGLAFSPDGKHMYFSYQHRGIIFDVWRDDGRPFHAKTLSIKYHETGQARSR